MAFLLGRRYEHPVVLVLKSTEAPMSFAHPLARKAKVWPLRSQDGSERRVLVVITTLVLDPKSEDYKKKLVDRLSDAVSLHLTTAPEADGFILLNRMREWDA